MFIFYCFDNLFIFFHHWFFFHSFYIFDDLFFIFTILLHISLFLFFFFTFLIINLFLNFINISLFLLLSTLLFVVFLLKHFGKESPIRVLVRLMLHITNNFLSLCSTHPVIAIITLQVHWNWCLIGDFSFPLNLRCLLLFDFLFLFHNLAYKQLYTYSFCSYTTLFPLDCKKLDLRFVSKVLS